MSTAPKPDRRTSVARLLTGALVFQLGLGALLVLGDIRTGFSLPRLGPSAPALTDPIRPGDQTRRFEPDRGRPSGRPMPDTPLPDRLQLRAVAGGSAIVLEGAIVPGDADRIGKQIAALDPPPERAYLNSAGGSVDDALQLGRQLRATGVATALRDNDICYSACPYLLAAGVTRQVPDSASVGVHQHFFGENTLLPAFVAVESIQRGQGEVMRYLDEMGVDPLVMQHALVTPPDEIYVLLPEELQRYGFVEKADGG